jgi:hypothetical protein
MISLRGHVRVPGLVRGRDVNPTVTGTDKSGCCCRAVMVRHGDVDAQSHSIGIRSGNPTGRPPNASPFGQIRNLRGLQGSPVCELKCLEHPPITKHAASRAENEAYLNQNKPR